MSLPKFGFSCGFNAPGGISICSLFMMSRISSGNPSGNGIFGTGKEIGDPNPGIEGLPGPLGDGNETSLGLQGHIVYLYIRQLNAGRETTRWTHKSLVEMQHI